MGQLITIDNVLAGKKDIIDWLYIGYKKDGGTFPLKVWENLECVLQKHNIELRLNLINHEIDYIGLNGSQTRNGKMTDIYALQIKEGLGLSREETANSIMRIAEKYSYNPFVDMLKSNKNDDFAIIKDMFEVLEIEEDNEEILNYYSTIFVKWLLNVVKMAHNTLENNFGGQGVLVLQGGQGCYKSTFCRNLLPNSEWFKGDKTLDPEKVDSVIQNTSYILVEWGELDSTLKGEQSKLKQFITSTNDEYRTPYSRLPEKYPRITSYIGTVNKKDFLKDETGSRRFWIIPVKKCIIDKMKSIDLQKFWGAVYSLWLSNTVEDYLTIEEQNFLSRVNMEFNYENDITITLEECMNWDTFEEKWWVYSLSEICEKLNIKEKKALKNELLKKGIVSKNQRLPNGEQKKGYKLPIINLVGAGYFR